MMLNEILFIEFILYIVTLLIGFNIHKDKKDKKNKIYHKYKPFLHLMILSIFLYSIIILYMTYEFSKYLNYVVLFNLIFILYFIVFNRSETRCWKQHRMIIYNFLLIPVIYFCSLLLDNWYYNLIIVWVCLYNILEFQFAKFSLKQPLIWD